MQISRWRSGLLQHTCTPYWTDELHLAAALAIYQITIYVSIVGDTMHVLHHGYDSVQPRKKRHVDDASEVQVRYK